MRRGCITALGALAALTATAAVAWACTPNSYLKMDRTSLRPGDRVTLSGDGFVNGPVTLRLYQPNADPGPLLATATGPQFTVTVTIPELAPGAYTMHGIARSGDGAVIGNAPAAFEVVAPPATSPGATGSAPASNAVGAPAARSSKPAAKAPGRTQAPGRGAPATRTQPGRAQATRPAATKGTPAASKGTSANHNGVTRAAQAAASTGGGGNALAPVPGRPGVARAKSGGQAVFTDSVPRVSGARSGPARSGTGAAAASGFGQSAFPTGRGTAGEPGPQLGIGAALLGIGLVLLFGGFAVAEVRRRRTPAGLGDITTRDRDRLTA